MEEDNFQDTRSGVERRANHVCVFHQERDSDIKEMKRQQSAFQEQFLKLVRDIHVRIDAHERKISFVWGGIAVAAFLFTAISGYVGYNVKESNDRMTRAIEKVEVQGSKIASLAAANETWQPVVNSNIKEIKEDIKSIEHNLGRLHEELKK